MGLGEKVVGTSIQQAVKLGQKSVEKYIAKLIEQNDQIIERLNWIMQTQQQIADHLKIKLDDPLEMEEKKKK